MHNAAQTTGVEMAGPKNYTVGRQAAIVAADRVRLLLNVVEGDEFLSEVLHSANATIANMRKQPDGGEPAGAPQAGPGPDDTRRPVLGPEYHSAKTRALRNRSARRGPPLGRA